MDLRMGCLVQRARSAHTISNIDTEYSCLQNITASFNDVVQSSSSSAAPVQTVSPVVYLTMQ